MSEYSIIEKIGQIAGIGGISLGVLLLIFKDVIKKNIFPNLSRQQAYNILRLIIILTFLIATFGIAAWVWSETVTKSPSVVTNSPVVAQQDFRRIYFQGFDSMPDNNEINNMWIKGESGDWRGGFSEGVHTLCNISTSESASFTSTFRYIKPDGKEVDLKNAKATVRVKVLPPSGKYSSAGILYRKGDDKPDYYAFVLNAGKSVSLMLRSGNRMRILWTKDIIESVNIENTIKLSVIGNGSEVKMYVNDQLVGEENSTVLSQGNPGVFAYSKGCFMFDEFSLYQQVK